MARSSLPAMSREDITAFILDRFGVDLHHYLVSPEHPLHPCALVAENIARGVLLSTHQKSGLDVKVANMLRTAGSSATVTFLCDTLFVEGKVGAYEESLHEAMKPLRPRREPAAGPE